MRTGVFNYTPKIYRSGVIPLSDLSYRINIFNRTTTLVYGKYFTPNYTTNSRYAEDVLSLTYSSKYIYETSSLSKFSIKYQSKTALVFEDNAGRSIDPSKSQDLSNLTRVWPAFGQIGGAKEFLAGTLGPSASVSKNFNPNIPIIGSKVAELLSGGRKQVFRADSIFPFQILQYLEILGNGVLAILTSKDDELRLTDEYYYMRINQGGLVIMWTNKLGNFTISFGLNTETNDTYVSVIGSTWNDVKGNNGLERHLSTTAPYIFFDVSRQFKQRTHTSNTSGSLPKYVSDALNYVINSLKKLALKKNANPHRIVKIP